MKCEHVSSHISSNCWEQSFFGNPFNANLPLWQLMGRFPDIDSVGLGHLGADDLQEKASRKDYDTLQWLSRPSDSLGGVGLVTNSKSYRRAPARMYPHTLRKAARPSGRSYTQLTVPRAITSHSRLNRPRGDGEVHQAQPPPLVVVVVGGERGLLPCGVSMA